MMMADGYWSALLQCRNGGRFVDTRVGPARELNNLTLSIDPFVLPRRKKMRRELGYMELCQFIEGVFILDAIKRVAPRVDMSLFGESAVYGPRVSNEYRDQLSDTIAELIAFPNSRRAIITISDPAVPLDEQPCISSMQFQIRADTLITSVYIRSWDLWFGAPHDLIVLSGVAQLVAACVLGSARSAGRLEIFTANAHIYERSMSEVSGPAQHWHFEIPSCEELEDYREWAEHTIYDLSWLSGAPKGITELFPAYRGLDIAPVVYSP